MTGLSRARPGVEAARGAINVNRGAPACSLSVAAVGRDTDRRNPGRLSDWHRNCSKLSPGPRRPAACPAGPVDPEPPLTT